MEQLHGRKGLPLRSIRSVRVIIADSLHAAERLEMVVWGVIQVSSPLRRHGHVKSHVTTIFGMPLVDLLP